MPDEDIRLHRQSQFKKIKEQEKVYRQRRMAKHALKRATHKQRRKRLRRLKWLYIPTLILLGAGAVMTIFGTVQGLGEGTFFWRHRKEFYTTGPVLLAAGFVMLLVAEGVVTREERIQKRVAADTSMNVSSRSESEHDHDQNTDLVKLYHDYKHSRRISDYQQSKDRERISRKYIPSEKLEGATAASETIPLEASGWHNQVERLYTRDGHTQTEDVVGSDVQRSVMLGAQVACLLLNEGFMSADRKLNIKTAIRKGTVTMEPIWETRISNDNNDKNNTTNISNSLCRDLHDQNCNIKIDDENCNNLSLSNNSHYSNASPLEVSYLSTTPNQARL